MTLKEINLTDEQQKELKDKLDAWKLTERNKIEETLTEKYEQMEAELKEQYEDLVEEIKGNMKKVYSKRFTTALKEMHEQIKAEVMVESLNSPETKALEEVKAVVYPLINEPTAKRHRDEFTKLAAMYENNLEEFELLKGANKKAQLLESLSPDIRKVVTKLLGEGNEQEIVEKFAAIKTALKEEVKKEIVTEDREEPAPRKRVSRVAIENIEEDEEELNVESSIEKPSYKKPIKERAQDSAFEKMLNEQLILSGLKKSR